MKKIIIKNIKLDDGQTSFLQLRKVIEEDNEFRSAIIKNDVANAIEEFWDAFQSKLGALDLMGVPLEMILNGQHVHMLKLEGRGHEFKEGIELVQFKEILEEQIAVNKKAEKKRFIISPIDDSANGICIQVDNEDEFIRELRNCNNWLTIKGQWLGTGLKNMYINKSLILSVEEI